MIKEDDNEKDATIDDNKRQIETKDKLSNAESNLKKRLLKTAEIYIKDIKPIDDPKEKPKREYEKEDLGRTSAPLREAVDVENKPINNPKQKPKCGYEKEDFEGDNAPLRRAADVERVIDDTVDNDKEDGN